MTASFPTPPGFPRIIVADDHEWILKALVRVVQETLPDAEVVPVEDGLQALHAYEREGANFLVTDHNMPKMDGMALIRRVREQTPELPILMVSVQAETKTDALAAGANWFMDKKQIMECLPPLLRQHAVIGRVPLET